MANNPPLLQQITQNPLLIDAAAKDLFQASIEHVVSSEHASVMLAEAMGPQASDEDFWPRADDWRSQLRPYNVHNGVLQIPVMGVLLNRFSYQFGRWATGYTYIEKAFERGMADGNVRGIAFVIDSPGGEVAGNFELVDKIYEARGEKPMRAFAADHAYSAAYSIASAAHQIIVTRSGGVGSIGVVTAHIEYADLLKEMGIKVTFIFAGKHKVDGNPYEKLPENVKSRIQERINRIYGVFTSTVARNRSMNESDVRGTEALTYDAKDAIEVGLADRLGSLEDEMTIFAEEAAVSGDENMATDNTETKVHTQSAFDAAVAKALADGKAEGKTEGTKEGMAAAKTRINAILASDAGVKRPKAALSAALKTEMTVEEATAFIADLPEEKAETPAPTKVEGAKPNPFEEAMKNGNPEVGAGGDGEGEGAGGGADKASSILANFAAASGVKRKKAAA